MALLIYCYEVVFWIRAVSTLFIAEQWGGTASFSTSTESA